jgi:hypothetical protein
MLAAWILIVAVTATVIETVHRTRSRTTRPLSRRLRPSHA